jgi:hypothetical protein
LFDGGFDASRRQFQSRMGLYCSSSELPAHSARFCRRRRDRRYGKRCGGLLADGSAGDRDVGCCTLRCSRSSQRCRRVVPRLWRMAKPPLAQQSPISAPWVAQKIKRQHHRIDERLQGLGCAVVVVRSLCHDDPLLRRFRPRCLRQGRGLIFALKVVRPRRNISKMNPALWIPFHR